MNAPRKFAPTQSTIAALTLLLGSVGFSSIVPFPSATAQTASPSIWKQFTNETGGFNLLMPGQPTENKSDGVTSFSVTRAREAVTYTVSFIDFPVNPAQEANGINDAFMGIKEGITEEGGKVQQEQAINLNNFPGQELRIVMPDGAITRIRSYIVGKRLFLIMASTTKEASLKKSLQGYLDSFRINPSQIPEATPPKATPSLAPSPSPSPTSTPTSSPSPVPSLNPVPSLSPSSSPAPRPTVSVNTIMLPQTKSY